MEASLKLDEDSLFHEVNEIANHLDLTQEDSEMGEDPQETYFNYFQSRIFIFL